MKFQETDITSLAMDPFAMLDDREWALVSAGTVDKFNTMTIGWGAMGVIWHRPVMIVFLRPQRYTKELVDSLELFTVSYYPDKYKKALGALGSKSGRDGDKITGCGLTPLFIDGTVAFEEAHTIIVCRKLFGGQQLDASKFVGTGLDSKFYPDKDYSFVYFGGIEKVWRASE